MNILVLTSVYRDKTLSDVDKSTNIVNSFVYEWVKQGHRVIVVHNSHRYPALIHNIPRIIKSRLASKMGFYISDYNVICKKEYMDNGAKIYRLPMLKVLPHKPHSRRVIERQIQRIERVLRNEDFSPDVIVGHWASPQMEIISSLKKRHECKTAVVLHGTGYIDQTNYPVHEYLKGIDKLGCRSKTQALILQDLLCLEDTPFVCHSGVPDEFLKKYKLNIEKYKNIKKWRFAYVGRLVKYKNVDTIINTLSKFNNDWQLDIVGEGAEEGSLKNLCKSNGCEEKVIFHGKIPRESVMSILSQAHCFIMVSKGEVFGLVYLEAMAASCVAIGSKGEGIDGIIEDGHNGFLCEPADVEALTKTIKRMISGYYIDVATCGYNTALRYSDSKVAEEYLNKILEN